MWLLKRKRHIWKEKSAKLEELADLISITERTLLNWYLKGTSESDFENYQDLRENLINSKNYDEFVTNVHETLFYSCEDLDVLLKIERFVREIKPGANFRIDLANKVLDVIENDIDSGYYISIETNLDFFRHIFGGPDTVKDIFTNRVASVLKNCIANKLKKSTIDYVKEVATDFGISMDSFGSELKNFLLYELTQAEYWLKNANRIRVDGIGQVNLECAQNLTKCIAEELGDSLSLVKDYLKDMLQIADEYGFVFKPTEQTETILTDLHDNFFSYVTSRYYDTDTAKSGISAGRKLAEKVGLDDYVKKFDALAQQIPQ